jgi:hypothetical protein
LVKLVLFRFADQPLEAFPLLAGTGSVPKDLFPFTRDEIVQVVEKPGAARLLKIGPT